MLFSNKIISESLGGSVFYFYLCCRLSEFDEAQPPPDRLPLHESHDILKGVYFDALFRTSRNLANFYEVMDIARVDAHMMCLYMLFQLRVYSYHCGFYACSFNLMGMQEPRLVGRARV